MSFNSLNFDIWKSVIKSSQNFVYSWIWGLFDLNFGLYFKSFQNFRLHYEKSQGFDFWIYTIRQIANFQKLNYISQSIGRQNTLGQLSRAFAMILEPVKHTIPPIYSEHRVSSHYRRKNPKYTCEPTAENFSTFSRLNFTAATTEAFVTFVKPLYS